MDCYHDIYDDHDCDDDHDYMSILIRVLMMMKITAEWYEYGNSDDDDDDHKDRMWKL